MATGARYRALFEASRDGIYVTTHDGRFLEANPAMVELFGYSPAQLRQINAKDLYADPPDRQRFQSRLDTEGAVREMEVRLKRRDGRELTCLLTAIAERDGDGEVVTYHGMIHDITDRRHAEERLRHAALHDGLTQLPNRTFFLDRVGRLLERMDFNPDYRFAVLFVDLDRFKLVNDSLGHRSGDELLVLVGERLVNLVRPEDIVARLGGDEFAVLLLDLPGSDEAQMLASRIHEGLSEPFDVLGHPIYVGASVGIVLSDPSYDAAEDVIRDADTAMYVAKERGGNGWALFDDSMHDRVVARLGTETALRRALEREEFVLHYQPLISMSTRSVIGFEALVRWNHPEKGLLLPADFLPVAEESGLIVALGSWVLREACGFAASWRKEGWDDLVMSVNFSPAQLHVPGVADEVAAVLGAHDLPGSSLRIEITETVFLDRTQALDATLTAIQALGVDLCLDDFGTGYSTLGYLRDLPIRVIKIDRSFVTRLSGKGGLEMVETILALAKQLGLIPVAEGVETEDQVEDLRRLGCENGQGFLFSRPVEASVARQLLAGESSRE